MWTTWWNHLRKAQPEDLNANVRSWCPTMEKTWHCAVWGHCFVSSLSITLPKERDESSPQMMALTWNRDPEEKGMLEIGH